MSTPRTLPERCCSVVTTIAQRDSRTWRRRRAPIWFKAKVALLFPVARVAGTVQQSVRRQKARWRRRLLLMLERSQIRKEFQELDVHACGDTVLTKDRSADRVVGYGFNSLVVPFEESTAMSAQARINGSTLAMYSPTDAETLNQPS